MEAPRNYGVRSAIFAVLFCDKNVNKLMINFKPKITLLLGLSIAKLKEFSSFSGLARYMRTSYPGIWGALVRWAKPFYHEYQTRRFDDYDDASFKDITAFNEQQWKKKLLRKREYNSYLTQNGVMNNRPVVESTAILERINRATSSHKY